MNNVKKLIEYLNIRSFYEYFFTKRILKTNSVLDLSLKDFADSKKTAIDFYGGKISKLLNIDSEFEKEIIELFQCAQNKETYEKLFSTLTEMDANKFSVHRWMNIQNLFLANGFFSLALLSRKKAKYCALNKKSSYSSWMKLIWYIEEGDADNAKKEISRLKKKWFYKFVKKDIDIMNTYVLMLNNNLSEADCPETLSTHIKKFLSNKDIVIIGPALDRDKAPQFEIDSRKLIARNNEINNENVLVKADISYFNGIGYRSLENIEDKDILNRVKYKIVSEINYAEKDDYSYAEIDTLFYDGHSNMLLKSLFDLIINNVNKIEVAGNNMFLSKKIHADGYLYEQKYSDDLVKSFAVHNIIQQYYQIENLYKAGFFVPDDELKYVLGLGIEEYLKKMDEYYGYRSRML